MARALDRLFTIDEWAAFEGKPETRYELIDGRLVAMAPPKAWHGDIAAQLASICANALRERYPCRARAEAGIEIAKQPKATVYVADVAVTCEPIDENRAMMAAPRLVIEIASPGTDRYDKLIKIPDYMTLSTVEEVWLVWSATRAVFIWRRDNNHGWPENPQAAIGKGAFESAVLGTTVQLDEIYRFVPLRAPPPIELPENQDPT